MMKSSILDELVKANRMPVLFVGSGFLKDIYLVIHHGKSCLRNLLKNLKLIRFSIKSIWMNVDVRRCLILTRMYIWEL